MNRQHQHLKLKIAEKILHKAIGWRRKIIEDGSDIIKRWRSRHIEDALEGAEVTVVLKGEDGDKISKTVTQDVLGIVARLATVTVQAEEDFDAKEQEIIAYPDNVVLPLDDDEIDYDKVVVTGDADSLDEIEKDDVLTLFYAKGEIEMMLIRIDSF